MVDHRGVFSDSIKALRYLRYREAKHTQERRDESVVFSVYNQSGLHNLFN